ncbi:Gfo/Idh/MocA family protein [Tautonia sociabilis]|uniref:Gfo/Idh/MocA family oxidoreductase n=1 Tax=Tautonia sociabilis TaxID=2080755 RepID=A0A432MP27_9BACT|nr:Gfo/Idh/MocA family oxidoreductase [Tautonia sociabilis]RUL88927.1 Gfo/Idh/MocA family oxidoreductase [Tautonia sociabilis]
MRIAIVGCGYVADYYVTTLANHPELELVGVSDRDPERAERFARHHGLHRYRDSPELLADDRVQLVLNLTNPRAHFDVSAAALAAGKHVYSEKPLATEWPRAVELVERAEAAGLRIASAPSTVLGEAAQTLWKLVREGAVGPVRLVYSELDEGLIHRENYRSWLSASGIPWPAKDEFEVGCTLEHAGYSVSWLAAMFGPAESVTSFASCQLPDKYPDGPLDPPDTPDFTVGCIRFASGVVARVTNSIIAEHDHALRVIGDDGELRLVECWDFASPIYLSRWSKWSHRARRYPTIARLAGLGPRRQRLVRTPKFQYKTAGASRCDFARGVAELAASIREGRPCRLSAQFSLHVNEIVLTLQEPGTMGCPRRLTTTFDPVEPMPWALGG